MKKINVNSNKVYSLKCSDYSVADECVRELMAKQLDDIGFDVSGKKVLIKPNLLAKRPPNMGVTTNPSILKSVADYLKEKGAEVLIGDSPGGMYNEPMLRGIYKVCGIEKAANDSGAVLNFDTSYKKVPVDGEMSKSFEIINPVADADLIVNLPRLKMHALCEMTAAVKNMFGSIPGLMKAEMHARFPKRSDFASMLVDLCYATAPQINILDAIVCMEGNGPAGGTLRDMGLLLGSINPFVLDRVAAYLVGYGANEVGTVEESIKRGYAPAELEKIEVEGEDIKKYACHFKRPDGHAGGVIKQIPTLFGGRLQKWLEPKPVVVKEKCIGCGECRDCCPVGTIEIINKKANIKPDKCIKCYCCQELCPMKAVDVKRKFFLKF